MQRATLNEKLGGAWGRGYVDTTYVHMVRTGGRGPFYPRIRPSLQIIVDDNLETGPVEIRRR